MTMKNPLTPAGIEPADLPICSTAPHTTVLPRSPYTYEIPVFLYVKRNMFMCWYQSARWRIGEDRNVCPYCFCLSRVTVDSVHVSCLGRVCTAATYSTYRPPVCLSVCLSVCLPPYNVTCSLVLAVRPSAAENPRLAAMLCAARSCRQLPCILWDFRAIRCASCVQPSSTLRFVEIG